jgi:hypothetical protein
MQVRVMGVAVGQRAMVVRMGVRLARWIAGAMAVLVVGIMRVPVLMLHGVMRMVVVVPLRQM